jgi:ribonuclease HII
MLRSRHTDDDRVEIGVDEAGRGSLWGPLVAGAVVWPRESIWTEEIRAVATQIKDSKKLTARRRAVLEAAIKEHAVSWGLGRVESTEIDEIGMTRANRLAFTRAIEACGKGVRPVRYLIDGILGLPDEDLKGGVEQVVEPQGDGTYLAIAAASILAKEGHDRMVRELCAAEPDLDARYALLSSKGYGTAKHREAIRQHGMHALHRRLFLRKLLGLEHTVHEESGSKGVAVSCDFLDD